MYIIQKALGLERDFGTSAIFDMIVFVFFFLFRPGGYEGTYSDDAAFKLQYVSLYIQGRRLDSITVSDRELEDVTSTSYMFSTKKNGHSNDKFVQGLISPVLTSQGNGSASVAPSGSWRQNNSANSIILQRQPPHLHKSKGCDGYDPPCHDPELEQYRHSRFGNQRSLPPHMLCSRIYLDIICMMGRWNSDAVIRYLHIQAPPIINSYASQMFNHGTLPDNTVPIIDVNGDD
jgi:hypothetical protein